MQHLMNLIFIMILNPYWRGQQLWKVSRRVVDVQLQQRYMEHWVYHDGFRQTEPEDHWVDHLVDWLQPETLVVQFVTRPVHVKLLC